ncbi:hypothetical protein [Bradyrhizobium sp. McL0616]|uniref:hypothetical protein n=1 Tax=Bradyrhizobium sp. McL0616 TaxID=3415674 RepID=UPI003CF99B17
MSEQLDIFEDIDEQTAITVNVGTSGRKRWRSRCLSVSPQFERARVARLATGTPSKDVAAPQAAPQPPEPAEAPALPRVVTTQEELLALLRSRRDELEITHEVIDRIAGWADGYASKVLSPQPIKALGEKGLALVLDALALGIARIEFVEDPELAARMRPRWTKRRRPHMRPRRTRGALLAERQRQMLASTTENNDVEAPSEFPAKS